MKNIFLVIIVFFLWGNTHAQSIDSLPIIKKNIHWLQNNYPNSEWRELSTKTINWIASEKYNFVIDVDPIENVINEKDIFNQYFAKVYFLSVFLYSVENDVLKNKDAPVSYGIKSMIRFYTIINEIDSSKHTNKALNFLMELDHESKLDDYIKRLSEKK